MPDLLDRLALVNDARQEDIAQYNNIMARIGTIRKVTRIPADSTDVLATDRVNDFTWDDTGFYYLTDATGTPQWLFIASATF